MRLFLVIKESIKTKKPSSFEKSSSLRIRRIYFLSLISLLGSGCSMDASIQDLSRSLAPIIENLNRKDPDFIHGEVVTTDNGYRMTAVFGEISEKQTTSSGWTVDGVFYE